MDSQSHQTLRRRFRPGFTVMLLVTVFVLVGVETRTASGQSEMPEFSGQRLTFSGVDSAAWQSLAAVITDLEKSGSQKYYVVVVESSGDGPTATRDYTDRLYEHWMQQAARNSLEFDPHHSVLVVLAIQNRQLSVHAGQSLQQTAGLTAQTIDQQLVQPHFIQYAKAGNYPEGIRVLLNQLNDRIVFHSESAAAQVSASQQPAIVKSPQIQETPSVTPTPDSTSKAGSPLTEVHAEGHAMQAVPRAPGWKFLTSPTVVAGTAIAVGLLMLLVLRGLHLRMRWILDAKKQVFRRHAVQLSDDIDALRERHRMLPFTDNDYQEPMLGETLAMYDGIQASLERLRQRWLELMDVWDKVDMLAKSEHLFGCSGLREAMKLLTSVPISDVEESVNEQCKKALDRLEDAHEQVQRLDSSLENSLQRVRQQLAELQSVQLAVEPYRASLDEVAVLRTNATQILVPDPIGSQTIQMTAGKLLNSVGQLTERILQHRRGMDELSTKLLKTSDWLAKLRSEGMRFCEYESDPSPLFSTIRHHCDESLKLLNLGEEESAAEHLKQGFELALKAQSVIQLQIDSKDFCLREIPVRTTEQRQLELQLKTLEPVLIALETEFAAVSWATVANLRRVAADAVSHGNTILAEATVAGSDNVQHYQKAAEALRQLKPLQSDAMVLISSGEQRLQHLRKIRLETSTELNELQHYSQRIASLLHSSSADRAAANQRFQEAEIDLQEQIRVAARSRADWPEIAESLSSIRQRFTSAEHMAREDIRLAERAAREIMNAQRELRQAESFYRSGFKADVAGIRPQFLTAQQALSHQQYERAIELADLVVTAARRELRQAETAADARERRRELERRDRNRSAGTGLGMISTGFSNSSATGSFSSHTETSSISMPAVLPSHTDSSTSSSSWSSETSQSSW